jgi:hypothetical protein
MLPKLFLFLNHKKEEIYEQIPRCRNHFKIDAPNTQIHDHLLSWFGTGTSIKCDMVELVYGP